MTRSRTDVKHRVLRIFGHFTAGFACSAAFFSPNLHAQQQSTPPAGLGRIEGTVIDSLHGTPLIGAVLLIDGVARLGQTGADGRYSIDSLPPGAYRVHLSHPILDTISMAVATPLLPVRPGEVVTVDMAVPPGERLISKLCPSASRNRGPGALIGQVVDPESDKPAIGSRVQFVYDGPNPLGVKLSSTIRESVVDSTGAYRICGLPLPLSGKLQVLRNGVTSGMVDVRIDPGPLGLRSLSVVATRVASIVIDSGGRSKSVFFGKARLTGKVVNKAGNPVQSARVSVAGSGTATVTDSRGSFRLDSLPSGTQSVEVRKVGYGMAAAPVELNSTEPAVVTVVMNDFELPAVRIEASRMSALENLGYLERKKKGFGYFLDGDSIRTRSSRFSDVLRTAPMLKISPVGMNRYLVTSSRDPNNGCVIYRVDGQQFRELSPGDIDDYVSPGEVAALEVYNPSSAPQEFETSGATKCVTVVIWTIRSLNRTRKK